MDCAYFENEYWEDFTVEGNGDDALAAIYIDGFPESGDGRVIAKVWITRHRDIVVGWHDTMYLDNETVLSLIEESKNKLREVYYTEG